MVDHLLDPDPVIFVTKYFREQVNQLFIIHMSRRNGVIQVSDFRLIIGAFKWRHQKQQLIHQHAQTPNIQPVILGVACHYLRGVVNFRSDTCKSLDILPVVIAAAQVN